jgi:recombination protein RecR
MDSLHRLEEIFAKFPGIGPRQARRFVYYLLNKPTGQINEFIKLVGDVRKMVSECGSCHRIYVYGNRNIQTKSATPPTQGESPLASDTHTPWGYPPISDTTSDATPVPLGVSLCSICSDRTRDRTTLMIVARDSDFETIEKSGAFEGLYFILGGTVPILDKEPDKRIRLETLLRRVSLTTANSSHVNSIDPSYANSTNSVNSSGANSSGNNKAIKEIILSLNTTPDGEHTANIVHDALNKVLGSNPVKISVLGRGLSTGAELEYVDSETIRSALKNRQ